MEVHRVASVDVEANVGVGAGPSAYGASTPEVGSAAEDISVEAVAARGSSDYSATYRSVTSCSTGQVARLASS